MLASRGTGDCRVHGTAAVLLASLLALGGEPAPAQECAHPLTGTVQDARTGVVLPGSSVRARWTEAEDRVRERILETRAGAVYRFCDLPAETRIVLAPLVADREGPPVTVTLPATGDETIQPLGIPLAAENTGVLVGRLVDRRSHRPIEAATVRLERPDMMTLTDSRGRFRIASVPSGTHRILLEHISYGEHAVEIEIPGDRTLDLELRLATRPIEMEAIDVVVRTRSPLLERRGFYERMQWGETSGASFLTPEDLERRNPTLLSHVLDELPGVRIYNARTGGTSVAIPYVGAGRHLGCSRGATVYVDQVRQSLWDRGVDQIPVSSVTAVEVYAPAQVPAGFGGSEASCGVVVIWTGDRSQ